MRYKVDAFQLSTLRQKAHLTVAEFASLIGWSVRYQYKLEDVGKVHTISQKTFDELCQAFLRKGIIFNANSVQ